MIVKKYCNIHGKVTFEQLRKCWCKYFSEREKKREGEREREREGKRDREGEK